MSQSISYLESIGEQVFRVSDLKAGDIVGKPHSDCDIRLYYVKSICLKPRPPILSVPRPRAAFLPPHIGLVIIDGKVFRHYIHTPSPGDPYEYTWAVKGDEDSKVDEDWLEEEVNKELFPLYLIRDESHIKLGKLIPELIVPSWGIMAQTTHGPELIFEVVDKIKGKLQKAQELYGEIRQASESVR